MSFGFSIGDFLAAGKLINDIVSSLRHSSASSYQELIVELHGLKRALDEIEHLPCPPGQEAALNSVKVAALMCQYPLDQFASKLKKYERLEVQPQHGDSSSKSDRLKSWGLKVQWGVGMEKDVVELRAYIATHVGSLNMRLITIGLSTTFSNTEQSQTETSILQSKLEEVRSGVIQSRREQTQQGLMITKAASLLQNLSDLVSIGIGVRLETLIELAQNIWRSNLQIMAVVTQLQSQPPRPDTSRTWFQDPVRFEDALGRVLPIPSEYGWSKVHAIIMDHFSTGPGSDKVKAEEYLLFNSLDSSQILLQARTEGLMPGMSITMAFIIGRHGPTTLGNCPRAGCVSRKIETSNAGGKFCTLCRCWFNSTNERIALPLQPERTPSETDTTGYIPQSRLRRERHADTILDRQDASSFNDRLEEERAFKNILINFTDLPGRTSQTTSPLGEEALQCVEPGCYRVFDQPYKLKHHRRYHAKEHKCPFPNCAKGFGTKTHLQRHINDRHERRKRFHCFVPGCDYSREGGKGFSRKDNSVRHMLKFHDMNRLNLPEPVESD
ncbi:hypothetical protein NCS57_01326200 [Fusarium keratoplasticum]|uniref:Uncharacterized protein n=1 Tax=Fusarium keratoplasticum TaxID=1328300 RepID=A0ACC0QGK7_9HYPO|nr:hypothetical protein NCS57_01326200 [Fusarium keratoplasticum]KAI8652617.1 hypothetical protein NCS57_01326200 [Fusarium keratoplasticum]